MNKKKSASDRAYRRVIRAELFDGRRSDTERLFLCLVYCPNLILFVRSRSAANARKSRHYNLKKYSKTDTISIVSKYSLIIGRRSAPVRTKERSEAARGACSSARCTFLGSLDRRAAWICSTARARPRKRIDQDCARGSRNVLQAVITMAPIRKRGESAPPAAPRFFQGAVPAQRIKTAPKEGCGSKNGFSVIGENWGNVNDTIYFNLPKRRKKRSFLSETAQK